MEGGLQASFEKMALGAKLLAMAAECLQSLQVDEAKTPLEAERPAALTALVARSRAEGGAPTDF